MSTGKLEVESVSRRVKGITLGELISKGLFEELKKELPTTVLGHIYFGFTDSDKIISVTHEVKEKKVNLDFFYLDGNDPKMVESVLKVMERVAGK